MSSSTTPLYSLETGSLIEPGDHKEFLAGLVSGQPQRSSCLHPPPSIGVTDTHGPAWLFTQMLGICTQTLVPAQKALLSTGPSPQPPSSPLESIFMSHEDLDSSFCLCQHIVSPNFLGALCKAVWMDVSLLSHISTTVN